MKERCKHKFIYQYSVYDPKQHKSIEIFECERCNKIEERTNSFDYGRHPQ